MDLSHQMISWEADKDDGDDGGGGQSHAEMDKCLAVVCSADEGID